MMRRIAFSLAIAVGAATVLEGAEPVQVWLDEELAVTYTARVEGDWLIVEVEHEPGWHTYAMDNVIRARAKTGKNRPDTELPTSIVPLEGLTTRGNWYQSPPLDLSKPEMRWYSWGFEGRSYFGVLTEAAIPAGAVQIDAQACTENLCVMVDALRVPVETGAPSGRGSVDPDSLVVVAREK